MRSETLIVSSSAFSDNGYMPVEYTGYGVDKSPPLTLSGIVPEAKSLAIIMVDLDIPLIREYPHWVIWNLPVMTEIPAAVHYGETLTELGNAKQGIAYGKHQYKGPKPPKFIRNRHRYVFTVYDVLDNVLDIAGDANSKALLEAMQGHMLQKGAITGLYKNLR